MFDIDRFFADSTPVVQSANLDLEEGENKQFDTQLLSNYFDTPMVVDEIRVQIISPLDDLTVGNFGGSIRLKLTAGRFALMDTYVPVGCLGPPIDGAALDSVTYLPATYSSESMRSSNTDVYSLGFFRWKLPRPLVLRRGMALEAKISRQIEGLSLVFPTETTLSANLAYVGRVSKKQLPGQITTAVPYVGLFTNVFTSASVTTSGQRDLYNPFQVPLNVQRLIGRWQNIYLDSGIPDQSFIALDTTGVAGRDEFDFPPSQIRTYDGFNVTNGFVPGLSIWEANTRSLPCNIQLERGEGFEVMIDATGGLPSTGAQPTPTGSNTSFVTMIGWRNETL
jgi:hypothetical protein